MTDNASIAADIAEMNRLMKVYATFDAESLIAKLLNAEIDRLSDVIEAALKVETPVLVTRLIPAGGMALTAEQVGWVSLIVNDSNPMSLTLDAWERVRALFPATEPAEDAVGDPLQAWKEFLKPKPIGWYSTMTREFATEHFGFPEVTGLLECTHTASDGGTWGWCGGDWELLAYPPAPAEPAEEETKAERRDPDELAKRMARIWEGGWDEFDEKERDYLRCAAEIARAYYASSPVVPAPTETAEGSDRLDNVRQCLVCGLQKDWRDMAIWRDADGAGHWVHPHCSPATPAETGPWQRIEDVPVGVPFKDREGSGLVKLADGQFGYVDNYRETSKTLAEFAPFVAAKEG